MKSLLGFVLGEDPREGYDPRRFAAERPRPAAPHPEAPPRPAPAPERPLLYGSHLENDPAAQAEPVPLGCWMVNQPGVRWPVRQQLQEDTRPLTVRSQIAATEAPISQSGSLAVYEPETFMNPLETTPDVIGTGSLINTYTGEIVDLFEDAMPPPTRQGGDGERERKQMQRRLLAAEGNVIASHRKREQQNPMQAGDAGAIGGIASYQVQADVTLEANARGARDLYFNRNELAPTELEMTRNPFGYEGFNNRLRILPWQPVTQELETKDWAPNATLLPGGQRPKHAARLRTDTPAPPRPGLVDGAAGRAAADGQAAVRRSAAERDAEGRTTAARCVASQQLYGDGVALGTSRVRLAEEAGSYKEAWGAGADVGPRVVTAASVRASLEALRDAPLAAPGRTDGAPRGGVVAAAQVALAAEAVAPRGAQAAAGPLGAAALGAREHAGARSVEAAPVLPRPQGELAGEARVGQRRASAPEQLYGDVGGAVFPTAAAAGALQQAPAPRKVGVAPDGRLVVLAPELVGPRAGTAAQTLRAAEAAAGRLGAGEPALAARPAVAAARLAAERAAAPRAAGAGGHDQHAGDRTVARRLAAEAAPTARAAAAGHAVFDQHAGDRTVGRRLTADTAAPLARAAGAGHGGLDRHEGGQVVAHRLAAEPALGGRAAATHRDFGGGERCGAASISALRGTAVSYRAGYDHVGGDADLQLRAERGAREWRPELVVRPQVMLSPGATGQRAVLGALPERRARVAKSPYRAGAERERGGLGGLTDLREPHEWRCEEVTEG